MSYLFFAIMQLISCNNKVESELHLIPTGYEGPVIIIFDQLNGLPEKYENGARVYEIPNNGILKTQFKQQVPGNIKAEDLKYYYNDPHNRKEIKYLKSIGNISDSNTKYIFSKEISDGTIRYLVGDIKKGDMYYDDLRKRMTELFPPKPQ